MRRGPSWRISLVLVKSTIYALGVCRRRGTIGRRAPHLFGQIDGRGLSADRSSQILCLTRSVAAAAVLQVQDLPTDTIVTDYSIGELAAWGVTGVWKHEETIQLAAARADMMD